MSAPMVHLHYTREFPHPIEGCYMWLTDYTDDDPSLTTEIIRKRRVVERNGERVVMDVENILGGRGLKGRAEVRFYPKEFRYEARTLEGDGGGILYTYKLTSLGPNRTRFDVDYATRVRKLSKRLGFMLIRPKLRRKVHTMWEGFAASMAKDLGN